MDVQWPDTPYFTNWEPDTQGAWWRSLDLRELMQLRHARAYAREFSSAGAPGHSHYLLVAKLSEILDEIVRTPKIQKVVWDDTNNCWRDIITGVKVQVS